jgi:acetylglutamate kinase
MVKQEWIDKANVLIEALPYIQRFNRQIIVVKYGGSAMVDEELKQSVIEDVVLLKLVGFKPVIVHGGGKEISKWLTRSGVETKFYDGLRITDADTLDVAEMVLGKVNNELVSKAESLGIKAVGISGKDGNLLTVEKNMPNGKDIGFVGKVKSVDTQIVRNLLDDDFLPIIYPIGKDENGQGYNINGDHAATAIAKALKANKLAYLTDIAGVCTDPKDSDTLISELYSDDAKELINDGTIKGGMIPKVTNCIEAIEAGVNRVHVLDGRIPHCLLLEIFTDKGIGTAILSGTEGKYYKGE